MHSKTSVMTCSVSDTLFSKRERSAGHFCWLAIAIALTHLTAGNAQPLLIDNFNDQDDDGWTYLDSNQTQSWGPTSFDASSGAYKITTPGDIPVGQVGAAVSLWEQSSDPMFSNGFMRAKVRTGNEGSLASLLLRASGDFQSGVDGYLFHASTGETNSPYTFRINVVEDTGVIGGGTIRTDLGFDVDEDWWIEAGVVDDLISMKVWRDGEPEPDGPQLTMQDDTLKTGMIGIESNIFANPAFPDPLPLDASFDDIHFVPIIPGDFNADALLDEKDLRILTQISHDPNLCSVPNSPGWCYYVFQPDLNQDGAIDFDDREHWVRELKNTWFGDSNLDGEFNSGDLVDVFQAGHYEDGIPANSTWASGDWNGDGEFDTGDLVFAFQDGGFEVGPRVVANSVPEPTSIGLLLLGAIVMRIQQRTVR